GTAAGVAGHRAGRLLLVRLLREALGRLRSARARALLSSRTTLAGGDRVRRREPRRPRRHLSLLACEARNLRTVHLGARRQLPGAVERPPRSLPQVSAAHVRRLVRVPDHALGGDALRPHRGPPAEARGLDGALDARAAPVRPRRRSLARLLGLVLPADELLPERLPARRVLLGAAHLPVPGAHLVPDRAPRREVRARPLARDRGRHSLRCGRGGARGATPRALRVAGRAGERPEQ